MPPSGVRELLNYARKDAEIASYVLDGHVNKAKVYTEKRIGHKIDVSQEDEVGLMNIQAKDIETLDSLAIQVGLASEA